MSIKGFHIVFVSVVTLLCVFMAVWAFVFAQEHSAMITAAGIAGVAGMLVMPAYGVYFYRKITRNHI